MAFFRRLLPLALFAASACGSPEVTAEADDDDFGGPAEIDWNDASVADGERLFGAVCAGCHGTRGDGKSRVAVAMFPNPRDLTRGEYRFRSTASGTLPSREDMLRTLETGLPGTAMPAWKSRFGPRQLRSLVRYLETLSPRFAEESRRDEDLVVDPEVLMPMAVTPGVLTHGRQVYSRMKCGQCHGADGRGDGGAAETHRNSDGSRSHVFDFTWGVYKGGIQPVDVYRTFMTGLDGTPMPSYIQSLPHEVDRWALVHYVRSLSRQRGIWFYLSERANWREPTADLPDGAPPQAADRGQ